MTRKWEILTFFISPLCHHYVMLIVYNAQNIFVIGLV